MTDSRQNLASLLPVPMLLGFLLGFASVAALDLNGDARAVRHALLQPIQQMDAAGLADAADVRRALKLALAACRLA